MFRLRLHRKGTISYSTLYSSRWKLSRKKCFRLHVLTQKRIKHRNNSVFIRYIMESMQGYHLDGIR